eukprot:TRINITY_DN3773_c0_g3_i3.p1 TRINITY_DN3773_c0_g3~~TRINITY_DN3773_c0_g3_i3.p1  ORF type:complete len:405 (-),score=113.92 TRINITY_DN3773_c0_g3_i3:216-1430(-)
MEAPPTTGGTNGLKKGLPFQKQTARKIGRRDSESESKDRSDDEPTESSSGDDQSEESQQEKEEKSEDERQVKSPKKRQSQKNESAPLLPADQPYTNLPEGWRLIVKQKGTRRNRYWRDPNGTTYDSWVKVTAALGRADKKKSKEPFKTIVLCSDDDLMDAESEEESLQKKRKSNGQTKKEQKSKKHANGKDEVSDTEEISRPKAKISKTKKPKTTKRNRKDSSDEQSSSESDHPVEISDDDGDGKMMKDKKGNVLEPTAVFLNKVVLFVKDVAKTVDFYKRAFGFKLKMMHPCLHFAELDSGENAVAFISELFAMEVLNHQMFSPADIKQNPQAVHLTFQAEDIDNTCKCVEACGGRIIVPPKLQPWGQTHAYVRDINGHLLYILSPPPPGMFFQVESVIQLEI